MKNEYINHYARLLTEYCCNIKKGDKVFIRSTYLAEPLILACQKAVLKAGGSCEYDITLPGMKKQFYEFSMEDQYRHPPILYSHAIEKFDVIISINAPYDIYELDSICEKDCNGTSCNPSNKEDNDGTKF